MSRLIKSYARRAVPAALRLGRFVPGGARFVHWMVDHTPISHSKREALEYLVFSPDGKSFRSGENQGRRDFDPVELPGASPAEPGMAGTLGLLKLRTQQVAFHGALWGLRRAGRSRIPGIKSGSMALIDYLPFSEDRLERLSIAMLGDDYGQHLADSMDLDQIVFSASRQSRSPNTWRKTGIPEEADRESAIEAMAQYKSLHVFMENGAALPTFLRDKRLGHAQITVHAFQNREEDLAALELGERASTASLRERFPDISPQAEALHLYARKIADELTAHVLKLMDVPQALKEKQGSSTGSRRAHGHPLSQGLEDDLSWRLSLLECYRYALADLQEDEAAIFVAATRIYVPSGLPLLLKAIPAQRFFLASPRRSHRRRRRFWNHVAKVLKSLEKGKAPRRKGMENGLSTNRARQKLGAFLTNRYRQADLLGENLAMRMRTMLTSKRAEVLFYAPSAPPYVETVAALAADAGRAEIRSRDDVAGSRELALVSCTVGADPAILQSVLSNAHDVGCAIDYRAFGPLLGRGAKSNAADSVETVIGDFVRGRYAYDGTSLDDFLLPHLVGFFTHNFFVALAAQAFGHAVASWSGCDLAMTCPGRNWLVRASASGFLAASQRGPLVDVQALNVLAHPKYVAPLSDYACVIDTMSAELYETALGYPADSIRITGSPRNDKQRDAVSSHGRDDVAAAAGLDPSCTRRVLLASQLQPFERMAQLASPLANLLAKDSSIELIIKMHPREGVARAEAYRAIFAEAGVEERVAIIDALSPSQVIAASDVCVTIYSNMAREAAVAGRDVVLALFTGWEPPIRLDLEGLATGAKSEEEFTSAVLSALDRRPAAEQVDGAIADRADPHAISPYFQRNPHLLNGDAIKAIRGALEQAVTETPREVATVPATTSDERTSIDSLFSGAAAVTVVMEDGLGIEAVPRVLLRQAPTRVFVTKPGPMPVPNNVELETGRYNTANRAAIDEAAVSADAMARRMARAFTNILRSTSVSRPLEALEEAVWTRLRPPLIAAERAVANLQSGLSAPSDHLLVVAQSDDFVADVAAFLNRQTNADKPKRCSLLRVDGVGDLAPIPLPMDSHSKNASASRSAVDHSAQRAELHSAVAKSVRERLDGWHSALQAQVPEIVSDFKGLPVVLFTTAWHLKTVPPTLKPVLSKMAELCPEAVPIILDFGNAQQDAIASTLADIRKQNALQEPVSPSEAAGPLIMGPEKLDAILPPAHPRLVKSLRRILEQLTEQLDEIRDASSLTRMAARNAAGSFARVGLWQTLGFHALSRGLLEQGAGVSLACPGRQWHAETAHAAAAQASRRSITVQNAYMSAGYTYTRPSGDVVTAIDTWSRDLFIETYDVPPETIQVTSTPRFDYLVELAGLDRNEAIRELELDRDDAIVLFAAQEGFDDDAALITTALAEMQRVGHPLRIFIKLHPRSPDSLVGQLQALPALASTHHDVIVTRDLPIQTLLAASDVTVTIYSNVGIEAAALGRPVVIAKFSEDELPLPLDRFGIGCTATTPEQVGQAVHAFFTDETFRNTHLDAQQSYFESNPLMKSGGSAAAIANEIAAGLEGQSPVTEKLRSA